MSSAEPEPFGGVTLESMAFSKPVIGTNIGGTPEQIIDDVTGILVAPNNSFEMGKAILKLINDPDLRKKWVTWEEKDLKKNLDLNHIIIK